MKVTVVDRLQLTVVGSQVDEARKQNAEHSRYAKFTLCPLTDASRTRRQRFRPVGFLADRGSGRKQRAEAADLAQIALYTGALLRRSALPTTDTELRLIARAAIMGFNNRP